MEHGKKTYLDVMNTFYGLQSELTQLIPQVLEGLFILVIGIAIAYILKWCSSILVKWTCSLLPSSITNKEVIKNNFESLVLGTGRILFFLVIFISLAMSLKRMGLQLVFDWMQNLGKHLPNIIGSLLILYIGWKAKELVEKLTVKALNRVDFLYVFITSRVLAWSIFIISVLVALEQVGIDMSFVISVVTVLVGAIAAGIVLTFALGAKATISDILYCYQLHKHLKVGQRIKIRDFKGIIKSIGPAFVQIETDQGTFTIPGNLFNREVTFVETKMTKSNV